MRYGANVHAQEEAPLKFAILNNNFEMAKLLLDHGSNPHMIYEWYISESSEKLKKLLLDYMSR